LADLLKARRHKPSIQGREGLTGNQAAETEAEKTSGKRHHKEYQQARKAVMLSLQRKGDDNGKLV
jgi:hypothetical protein